ncbi:MAG TPA: leucine--tRNA ligase, partial [Longimicrobiales bacterium]|nr:leucine--tRNA ligase [Longimicrobiales bacterium]
MSERAGYDPIAIEEKWQKAWAERGTNLLSDEDLRDAERPFYMLMMYPYPSAEGLHVGNMYAFTGADIFGRYRRLNGFDVFEPIGFDAFGIHSENYALKVDVHPMELIPRNVANFTRQLKRIGGMYDWNHTVDTTDPGYYKWTQWIFLKLHEAGLAERKEAPVNWCPSCMTVLANEQVIAGACERCATPVEQRFIAQWFFRITEYTERLLENLSWIDWSESTKKAQENWIGRSEGAEIRFPIARSRASHDRHEPATVHAAAPLISVFTTRPDTIFGATYMVLAPEHPLVEEVTTEDRRDAVAAYRREVAGTDLVSRKKADKEKSGIFTGAYAVNPATGEEIPIWIADYVLMEYGTGAIMAVPGHDERDFEFATAFGLPIVRVVAREGEDADTPLSEAYPGHGTLVNSGAFDGAASEEGQRSITAWLAEKNLAEARVNYRLHDWCISRQRYWGPPIPIIYCDACGTVPVPEEDLPVELPHVDDYKPDESGVSPLARAASWYRVACPECGGEARRETDVSDTFLDSAWYFLRYPSAHRDDVPFDAELTEKWLPVSTYIGGEEHAVLHLLYSRFVTMALHDAGYLGFEEPYRVFRKHALITKDGAKMSKSRGNTVVPDKYIERWGADTFRTYLMFLGPFQIGGDFRDEGIQGPYGFLSRLWDTIQGELRGGHPDSEVERRLHATIRKVTEDVAGLRYNTAIAAMMEYLNAVRAGNRAVARTEVEPLVPLIAPFAPHLAEEAWELLGHEGGIFDSDGSTAGFDTVEGGVWPTFDPEKAKEDSVEFVVQVNGKVRARVELPRGVGEHAALTAALADENVGRWAGEGEVRKV